MVNQVNSTRLSSQRPTELNRTPVVSQQKAGLAVSASVSVAIDTRTPTEEIERLRHGQRGSLLGITAKAHHQLAKTQTALSALHNVEDILQQSKQLAQRSLKQSEGRRQRLMQELVSLQRQLSQQAHQNYDEKPLFNADFSVRHLNRNQQQRFSIRGLRLQGDRTQPEVLKFAFDGGKPRQVKVQIEPDDDMADIARKLSRGLSARGIRTEVDKWGDLEFSAAKGNWQDIEKGFWLTGNGQVFPAGNPVKVQPEQRQPQMVDADKLSFRKTQDTRQSLSDIERLMQQVRGSLQELVRYQQQIEYQLQGRYAQMPETDTTGISDRIINKPLSSLLAQAGISRQTVVSLLTR
ncbi:MAG: hypothetical protein ACRCZ4_10865 [Plesiomonas sp.]|uniref:hypothetical protein n=1 Tax=Plesiomonas sp. TaxID=2486279 RepID=UPI003F403CC0